MSKNTNNEKIRAKKAKIRKLCSSAINMIFSSKTNTCLTKVGTLFDQVCAKTKLL